MKTFSRGQTAVEYLLILAVMAVIALVSFNNLLPAIQNSQDPTKSPEGFFTKVDRVILGENPQPINGGWCPVECSPSGTCGDKFRYRTCECPAPAFGGKYCSGSDMVTCPGVTACPSAAVTTQCNKWADWGTCSTTQCGVAGNQFSFCEDCGGTGCPPPRIQNCSGTECANGKHCNGKTCDDNACKGSVPAHATACANNISPSANAQTPYTLVDSCDSDEACQATCNGQYANQNGTCVLCQGTQPANSTICPNAPLPGASDRFNLADNCNSPKACQVICQSGATKVGNVCRKNCNCTTGKCTNNSATLTCTPNIAGASCPSPRTIAC